MNTTQLQCFTTLAGTLNYMRAADELSMTQPAVSRQIQSLEQELGAKLFHRTTRSVSLTQIGQAFLPEATAMLSTYYRSLEWINKFHNASHHFLRIGYADTRAMPLVSGILRPVIAAEPLLTPEFTLDQTDANLGRLTSGELDLVFGIRDAKFSHEAVAFLPLHEEYFLCVCRKDHPLALDAKKRHRKSVSSEDLFPHRQIFDIPPYLLKEAFSRGHRILPVNEDLDNMLCANASETCALVLAGAGYALLPEHLLPPDKELKFLPWKESPHTQLGIYCFKAALEEKNSTVRRFVKAAREFYNVQSSSTTL